MESTLDIKAAILADAACERALLDEPILRRGVATHLGEVGALVADAVLVHPLLDADVVGALPAGPLAVVASLPAMDLPLATIVLRAHLLDAHLRHGGRVVLASAAVDVCPQRVVLALVWGRPRRVASLGCPSRRRSSGRARAQVLEAEGLLLLGGQRLVGRQHRRARRRLRSGGQRGARPQGRQRHRAARVVPLDEAHRPLRLRVGLPAAPLVRRRRLLGALPARLRAEVPADLLPRSGLHAAHVFLGHLCAIHAADLHGLVHAGGLPHLERRTLVDLVALVAGLRAELRGDLQLLPLHVDAAGLGAEASLLQLGAGVAHDEVGVLASRWALRPAIGESRAGTDLRDVLCLARRLPHLNLGVPGLDVDDRHRDRLGGVNEDPALLHGGVLLR
mmetsp:Transcript_101583/g.264904  ORF Transcript_101583/g.264904 Transcript_101583/m.264904 type:complete len:392 (-) Transcript_101583:1063-2238(-)